MNALLGQSILYYSFAIAVVALTAWWLYWSPLRSSIKGPATPPRTAALLAGMIGIAAVLMVVGALWDASRHIQTGEVPGGADFLWAPHIMIYSSFFITYLVALLAVWSVAAPARRNGVRDPRQWVRQNPSLGALALASFYTLVALPGDAIWHELVGIDLTAWSPPHVMLGISSSIILICAVNLLSRSRAGIGRGWYEAATVALLSLSLNVAYLMSVIEWELPPPRNPIVEARAPWLYPFLGGALAFLIFSVAQRMVAFRWAATATALAFYALRLAVTAGLFLGGLVVPAVPLPLLAAALVMDLMTRFRSHRWYTAAMGLAFTTAYALPVLLVLARRDDLRPLSALDAAYLLGFLLLTTTATLSAIPWSRKLMASLQSRSGAQTASG